MEWIKCSDRLPPFGEYVLLYAPKYVDDHEDGPLIFVGILWSDHDYECAWGDGFVPFILHDITHWMPLPEPPKE